MEIKLEKFEQLRAAPKRNGKYEPAPRVRSPFSPETFELLAGLHDDPTKTYHQEHREGIRDHVEEPFRRLVRNVAKRVRAPITGLMETEKDVFARILKHDRGRGARGPTREALVEAMGAALDAMTASDAYGFFGNCGYRAPAQSL